VRVSAEVAVQDAVRPASPAPVPRSSRGGDPIEHCGSKLTRRATASASASACHRPLPAKPRRRSSHRRPRCGLRWHMAPGRRQVRHGRGGRCVKDGRQPAAGGQGRRPGRSRTVRAHGGRRRSARTRQLPAMWDLGAAHGQFRNLGNLRPHMSHKLPRFASGSGKPPDKSVMTGENSVHSGRGSHIADSDSRCGLRFQTAGSSPR
jgi:hypothetical protein